MEPTQVSDGFKTYSSELTKAAEDRKQGIDVQ
jgi:hypothetical protein